MHSKNIFNGLKWASIELVFDSVIKFSIKLILAKLLLPEDFGLLGMCMIFIGLTQAISNMGMGAALIQKKDDAAAKKLYHTAFWSNLLFGLLTYSIISLILGPLIAVFYEEPILKTIIPVLSLSLILQPFVLIPNTILTRNMDFKRLSKAYNIASLISGIFAVTIAYFGFGVWALIFDYILSTALAIPIVIIFSKWTPKLEWKKEQFNDIFSFGIYTTGTSLMRAVAGNIDYLIIGKLLGPSLLGSYTLAFMLTDQLKSFLSRVINKVMYPVFSKFQDNIIKLKSFFLTILKINALMIYPLMSFLVYFGEDIVLMFFGEKWIEAIIPLKILAFTMILNLLINAFDTLLRGKGKPKLELKIITLVNLLVLVPAIFIGVHYYGLIGASIAVLINTIVLIIVAFSVLNKEINLNPMEPFIAVKSPLIGSLLSVVITLTITNIFDVKLFYYATIPFVLIYIISIYFLEKNYFKQILKSYF